MGSSVLKDDEANRVAVAFNPKKFPVAVTQMAKDFVAINSKGSEKSGAQSAFRIERIVAEQTGIAELERLSIEERVEREALVRLKEFQEVAYEEAYQLGLEEGQERAFQERSAEFSEKLQHFETVLNSLENLKRDLIVNNEVQIVKSVFYMAKRLVYDEISARPELVLQTVREALLSAQSDEQVVLRVSPSDLAFIESVKEKLAKEFDTVKRSKIEPSSDITNGGCVIETNYGDVDATLEQRIERLWISIAEKLPKTQDIISSTETDGEGSSGASGSSAPGEGR